MILFWITPLLTLTIASFEFVAIVAQRTATVARADRTAADVADRLARSIDGVTSANRTLRDLHYACLAAVASGEVALIPVLEETAALTALRQKASLASAELIVRTNLMKAPTTHLTEGHTLPCRLPPEVRFSEFPRWSYRRDPAGFAMRLDDDYASPRWHYEHPVPLRL